MGVGCLHWRYRADLAAQHKPIPVRDKAQPPDDQRPALVPTSVRLGRYCKALRSQTAHSMYANHHPQPKTTANSTHLSSARRASLRFSQSIKASRTISITTPKTEKPPATFAAGGFPNQYRTTYSPEDTSMVLPSSRVT